jgi:hypothetical protein
MQPSKRRETGYDVLPALHRGHFSSFSSLTSVSLNLCVHFIFSGHLLMSSTPKKKTTRAPPPDWTDDLLDQVRKKQPFRLQLQLFLVALRFICLTASRIYTKLI